ncbi:phage virion morphogenesis protein [Salinicola sp. JS01]|uniref:phage virion morphogenesis protein n=1 Tax=Salinicola sp. JS01 TaxID=3050071 RepID=UPI00255C11CD|nr:phage virion morphogenesis protein [Salinicola sp. JS01]WIX31242.1 phage virion morphogenesis protein [Salinicola sp. JS01]
MAGIEIDSRQVVAALNALMDRGQDLRKPLEELGEYFIVSTKRRFEEQQAPDGTPWPANSPVTLARKSHSDPLIGETRRLHDEIHYVVDQGALEWGSSLVYAAMQQFGGTPEEFPQLWGDVPAREFLGVSDVDNTVILETLRDWLEDPI